MSVRVLICGSRDWTKEDSIRDLIERLPADAVVIHGAAKGADEIADRLARARGLRVEAYPADWRQHGKAAGPIRNQRMIDEGKPDAVEAFVLPSSRGTWDMVRRAKKAGVMVIVVHREMRR